MPRKSKGGPYRSDIATQAVKVAPSQQYGEGARQQSAQAAMPLPKGNPAPPAPAPAPMNTGGAPMPAPGPAPGAAGPLDRPTGRPNEPITSGLPMGAGPGMEAMRAMPDPNQQDMEALRPYLGTLELLADLPSSSSQTRNFVRRLRGGMKVPEMGAQ